MDSIAYSLNPKWKIFKTAIATYQFYYEITLYKKCAKCHKAVGMHETCFIVDMVESTLVYHIGHGGNFEKEFSAQRG